jgi:hypothetical protein
MGTRMTRKKDGWRFIREKSVFSAASAFLSNDHELRLKYQIARIPTISIPPNKIAFFFTWKLNWLTTGD